MDHISGTECIRKHVWTSGTVTSPLKEHIRCYGQPGKSALFILPVGESSAFSGLILRSHPVHFVPCSPEALVVRLQRERAVATAEAALEHGC